MPIEKSELDFLDYLSQSHLSTFNKVYQFLENVLQWNNDPSNLPRLEELWGILELAGGKGANFEYGANERGVTSLDIKSALTSLINYVLWGCRVSDSPKWHVIYNRPKSNHYEDFVRNLPKERTIISLNYDTELDEAIRQAKLPIDYGSNFIPFSSEDIKLKTEKSSDAVLLLKPHGSFNWLYCPTCNRIEDFGLCHVSHIPLEQEGRGLYCKVDSDLPCEYDRTLREAVIIPPSLIKFYNNPHLDLIWRKMAEELRLAEEVVFIGYSFGGADIYLKHLVLQSLSTNPHRFHKLKNENFSITVVNLSIEAIEEYANWFGKDNVHGIRKPFSEYVNEDMKGRFVVSG